MIIDHYKKSGSIFTTVVVTLALVLFNLYIPFTPRSGAPVLPLANALIRFFSVSLLKQSITLFVLANLIAFVSYIINDRFIILNQRSYFPYFLAGTLVLAGPYMQTISPAHFSFIFVFIALFVVLQDDETNNASINIVNASLILSLGSFIQFQTLLFVPVIWFANLLHNRLNFKTFQASLVGCILPYLIATGYFYVFGSANLILDPLKVVFKGGGYGIHTIPEGFWLVFSLIAMLVIVGFFSFLSYRDRLNSISRKSMEVFVVFMILNLVYFIIGLLPLQSSLIYGSLSAGIIISGLWIRMSLRSKRLIYYSYLIMLLFSFVLKF